MVTDSILIDAHSPSKSSRYNGRSRAGTGAATATIHFPTGKEASTSSRAGKVELVTDIDSVSRPVPFLAHNSADVLIKTLSRVGAQNNRFARGVITTATAVYQMGGAARVAYQARGAMCQDGILCIGHRRSCGHHRYRPQDIRGLVRSAGRWGRSDGHQNGGYF